MAEGNTVLEAFGATINDMCDNLPKSRGRCFDIGIWGGCGETCAAFVDGECENACDIDKRSLIEEYGENEAQEIMEKYGDTFK